MAKFLVYITLFGGVATAVGASRTLMVSGEIDPSFDIDLKVLYMATKKSWFCKYTVNWLEGASSQYSETRVHKISSSSGRYDVSIPLEDVDPNTFCAYKPFSIEYIVRDRETGYSTGLGGERPVFLWFTLDGHESAMRQDIRCRYSEVSASFAPPLKGLRCTPTWEKLFLPRTAERARHAPLLKESVRTIKANFLYDADALRK